VVDEHLMSVADGETGELCVAGPQTTPGYWRAPQLSAERFFERDGDRYYRTGDLVRLVGDTYVCLGRSDQQVKVGGNRIELGEIEAALRRCGSVEAVCLVWPDESTLTAVVSGAERSGELIEAAARQLPAYMVPKAVHPIPEMPRNGNGKVDRNALREWLDARADRTELNVDGSAEPES
jgi:acyl-CoA synthetase (AMP-forming)/AMP-acid ligase II